LENSQNKQALEQLERKLLQELTKFRDEATRLSLLLHDLKFEVDGASGELAAALAADCIARSRSRRH
jgi:hypothetical protein